MYSIRLFVKIILFIYLYGGRQHSRSCTLHVNVLFLCFCLRFPALVFFSLSFLLFFLVRLILTFVRFTLPIFFLLFFFFYFTFFFFFFCIFFRESFVLLDKKILALSLHFFRL